ncbi:major facilitator superfamily transporter multidrug resistance [Sporothrix schenckii 1099-18]|uniref:Major facilitator superfamily transporter multidrug resistance n=1 Tax=Sporothrix schenckii 1099-18 TaxID=1397361 RepID=A0A0F2MBS9_SPOSC|nr:major facilitator superfamily transporter multidrug resistance [Sporothrix schenckii 1099-18]KJR87158.1 major facilitator superfamily transporter multidrug resistance [Sporothrix schenckii 1099-18]
MPAAETTSVKSVASTVPTPRLETENVSCQQKQDRPAKDSHRSPAIAAGDIEAATATPQGDDNGFPISNLAPWRFWTLSLGVGLGLFLAMLDSSIVATSLLTIGRELGSIELINWVALAYTLAYLSCAVIFARIADIVGRRNAFLAAFLIFFGFSIGCGFAKTLHQLIALRALQGVGGSGLYSLSMIIWPELSPIHLKRHVASLAGVVVGMAGVLGPILGGLLTNYASWRWIFWINGPIGFFSMAVFALTWPDEKYLPAIARHPWSSLDIIGSILLITAAALVTFAFQNAGVNPDQWSKAIFLAPLITGIFCWAALFIWQAIVETRWTNIMPAFPLKLLRNHVYAAAALITLLLGFPLFSVIFTFPLRLQIVNGKSGLMAGVMMLPLLVGVSFGSALTGFVNAKKNRLTETLLVGGVLMVIGCALETTLSDSATLPAKALGFLPFIGLGLGLCITTTTVLAATEAPPGDHAASQGIIAQARVLGGSIGIAASSAILARQELAKLGTVVTTDVPADLTGDSPTAVLVRQVFNAAFTENMRICAVISAVGIVVACGTYTRNRQPLLAVLEERAKQEAAKQEAAAV